MPVEYANGSSASGVNGATNRVLTLANTSLTVQNDFYVYVSGLLLALTDEYTVTHSTSGSQVTFLNGLWNDLEVIVVYRIKAGSGNDFENGPLNDLGVTVTRTPVTESDSNIGGQRTYTDGTTIMFTAVIKNITKGYFLDKAGETIRADALLMVDPDTTINKHDKIGYNSQTYRVDAVSPRIFEGTTQFKSAILFLIT